METSQRQEQTTDSDLLLSKEETEARDYIANQTELLRILYLAKIRQVASEGFENGFSINVMEAPEIAEGAEPQLREKNILTGEEEWRLEWKAKPYRKQTLTTKDYSDFVQYRYKWLDVSNNPAEQARAEDMENRLYEFGAKKFLEMSHSDYLHADKEQVRIAVDACVQISAWNGNFATKKQFEDFMSKRGELSEFKGSSTLVSDTIAAADVMIQQQQRGDEAL